MKKLFSIGEVSKIKGITIKTLRYYHKIGILIPYNVDEYTGYRYYSIEQFIRIDIIKVCRSLGTSIVELQRLFKECDTDKLLEFLQHKKIEAEDSIRKTKETIYKIDALNDSIQYSKDVLHNDEIVIRYFSKRYIVVCECKALGDLEELLYYSDLDKVIKENNVEANMERGIIYNLKSNGILEPMFVFGGVREGVKIDKKEYIKVLPEGNYLTVTYNNKNEEDIINKIAKYVDKHRLNIKIYIELELYNELFDIENDSYSCQIQILIEANTSLN